MSSVLPQQGSIAPDALEEEPGGAFTRRTVLTGAAAVTAAATVGATLDTSTHAHSVDPNSREHMVLFVLLSSALTGIPVDKLAPGFRLAPPPTNPPTVPAPPVDLAKSVPGSDPVDVKREYLTWANEKFPSGLEYLLRLVRINLNASNRDQAIIDALRFDDGDKNKTPMRPRQCRRTTAAVSASNSVIRRRPTPGARSSVRCSRTCTNDPGYIRGTCRMPALPLCNGRAVLRFTRSWSLDALLLQNLSVCLAFD